MDTLLIVLVVLFLLGGLAEVAPGSLTLRLSRHGVATLTRGDRTRTRGRLDRDWAAVRVIEWAPYQEMVRLIGFRALVDEWSRWRSRSHSGCTCFTLTLPRA